MVRVKMDFHVLMNKIAAITYHSNSIHDYLLSESGVKGFFHLGEKGRKTLHLEGVTAEAILQFVSSRENR
jgi:hypothetical protein